MSAQWSDQTEKGQSYTVNGVRFLGMECEQGKDRNPDP